MKGVYEGRGISLGVWLIRFGSERILVFPLI